MAKELGFEAISGNSMDATSDRDFAIEFAAAAALLVVAAALLAILISGGNDTPSISGAPKPSYWLGKTIASAIFNRPLRSAAETLPTRRMRGSVAAAIEPIDGCKVHGASTTRLMARCGSPRRVGRY